ncbi:hypothetical protein [Vibrio amylolyticus]|uniref:hypothetical protein n=1 Tax=Vibrio amylolyticus TaxID=2847292 RepID=UPI0035510D85
MSNAKKVADEASCYIETLLAEMFEGNYPNNEVLLGILSSGSDTIQVQLKITRNAAEFMDEC